MLPCICKIQLPQPLAAQRKKSCCFLRYAILSSCHSLAWRCSSAFEHVKRLLHCPCCSPFIKPLLYVQSKSKTVSRRVLVKHHIYWMQQLGKLLYIVERNCKIIAAKPKPKPSDPASQWRQSPLPPSQDSPVASRGPLLRSRGFPPPFPSRYSPRGSRVGPQGYKPSKGAIALQQVSTLSHPHLLS